ncbi:hypothetical protein GF376_02960 [Candidatus Peregrinibacteria bacterium]|nr:hypothetical protein [Candidatus Peregrinibacteria bacterium]
MKEQAEINNPSKTETTNFSPEQAQQISEQKEHQPENEIDKDLTDLEKIIAQENIDISPKDFKELQESVGSLFKNSSPELAEYLNELTPQLTSLLKHVATLREKNQDYEALNALVKFLEEQMNRFENIKDKKLRDTLTAYVGSVLNIDKIEKSLNARKKVEMMSAGVDVIPVVGSIKMLGESAYGKKMTGEHLTNTGRISHGAAATAYLGLDAIAVAGLVTGGTVSAVAEGGKVAATTARIGSKGARIASTITRFAALARKTTGARKASKALFKVGKLVRKYPKLTGAIAKLAEKRRKVQIGSVKEIGMDAVKTARKKGREKDPNKKIIKLAKKRGGKSLPKAA